MKNVNFFLSKKFASIHCLLLSLKEDELPDVEGDLGHVADEEEGDDEEKHHGLPRLLRVGVGVGAASHRVAPPLLNGSEMYEMCRLLYFHMLVNIVQCALNII